MRMQNTKRSYAMNRRSLIETAIGLAGLTALSSKADEKSKATAGAAAPANPVIETAAGKVRGFTSRGVAVYRGIPYGASTTGPNRFMPPKRPESWTGVRNCLSYGHSCPQGGTGVIENDAGGRNTDEDAFLLYRTNGWIRGEDCLRLNVWT